MLRVVERCSRRPEAFALAVPASRNTTISLRFIRPSSPGPSFPQFLRDHFIPRIRGCLWLVQRYATIEVGERQITSRQVAKAVQFGVDNADVFEQRKRLPCKKDLPCICLVMSPKASYQQSGGRARAAFGHHEQCPQTQRRFPNTSRFRERRRSSSRMKQAVLIGAVLLACVANCRRKPWPLTARFRITGRFDPDRRDRGVARHDVHQHRH